MRYLENRYVDDINNLLKQLSNSARNLSLEDFRRVFKSGELLVIFDEDRIIGMACVHFRETCIRKIATIEDVVVDKEYRKKGFGEKLVKSLVKRAQERGANRVELTSKPKRVGANALYKKMGFKKINTNYYRLEI